MLSLGEQRLRGRGFADEDAAIKLNVIVGHSMGVETLTCALEGAIGKIPAHLRVTTDNANRVGKTGWIIGAKIHGGVVPKLAQRRNVVKNEGTARKRRFQNGHTERFITRGARVNC